MTRDESTIGTIGLIVIATRGAAGPGEVPIIQYAREVGQRSGVVAAIPAQNLSNSFRHDWLLLTQG